MYWFVGAAGLLVVLAAASSKTYINVLKSFLPSVEGFSATPYWDVNCWRWGYGTKVTNAVCNRNIRPSGTITRDKAMRDLIAYVEADYSYLKPLVKVKLNPKQWAAYLSFSYNVGRYAADNLLPNLNAWKLSALENQWKQYIYSDGEENDNLIVRRDKEWKLFRS